MTEAHEVDNGENEVTIALDAVFHSDSVDLSEFEGDIYADDGEDTMVLTIVLNMEEYIIRKPFPDFDEIAKSGIYVVRLLEDKEFSNPLYEKKNGGEYSSNVFKIDRNTRAVAMRMPPRMYTESEVKKISAESDLGKWNERANQKWLYFDPNEVILGPMGERLLRHYLQDM